MENVGYYNGELAPLDQIKVPMLDRACFYGDGVYDATITHQGVILYQEDHIERFFNSMRLMRFEPDFSREELAEILQHVVDACDAESTFLYWQVTRGTGPRQHPFLPGVTPNLWAYAVPHPLVDLADEPKGITVEDTRFYHRNAKTLNLLPNVLAAEKARAAGCEEAIFYRAPERNGTGEENRLAGRVTECAHSNIHILKNGTFRTAPLDDQILPGIARANLIKMCGKLGIPVDETPFTVAEMLDADEVIHSSSGSFCVPVDMIDGTRVGGRDPETLKKLQDALVADWLEKTE
jgi:D-alanine transaminase